MLTVTYTNTFGAYTATADIEVVSRSLTESAPEGVVLGITNYGSFDTSGPSGADVYDPRIHDLHYYWQFDDVGTFAAPSNLIGIYENSNIGYTNRVTHTFRAAGSYDVSCLIVEPSSGKTALAELTVVVGDPDTTYAGTRSIWVHPTSDTTDRPAAMSGSLVATSIDSAMTTVFTGAAGVPRRIMLAKDQTYTPTSLSEMGQTANRMDVLICSGPTGTNKPVVNMANVNFQWGSATGATDEVDLKFQGIRMTGPWDSTTCTGTRRSAIQLYENRPQQMLIDQCEFDGFDLTVYNTFGTAITGDEFIVMNDNDFTNWRGACYFSLGETNVAASGNRMSQHVDALSGYSGAENNMSAATRIPRGKIVVWHQNDMFGRTGWYNRGTWYDSQGCFRGNTDSHRGAYYSLWGNSFEGGFGVVGFDNADGAASLPINGIIEKNILVGDHDTNRLASISFGGMTFRNNICIIPNTSRYADFGLDAFVSAGVDGADSENASTPIRVYNNTFICLLSTANLGGGVMSETNINAAYTADTVENNINLQPNRGGTSLTGFDTTIEGVVRYLGYEDDVISFDGTKATPSATRFLPVPSSTISLTTGLESYDDFLSNVRGGSPSTGALEPA